MYTTIRATIAAATFAALSTAFFANLGHTQGGQTGLSKCYDSVVAACNKKSGDAVNACANSGFDQCDKQHKASIIPPAEISKLRANATRNVQPAPMKRN